jgi:hypothetical protein
MAAYAYSQFYDEYDYADEFLPTTTPTPSYPATTGGGAGFDTNSQGTITATSSTPVSNTFAGVAKTSTPVPNTSGFSFGSSALRGPSPSASRLPYNSLHIIPLFGLFLRLDSYAQLMIQTDRLKAKKLLCLALDIKPIERSMPRNCIDFVKVILNLAMSEFIASLQPVKKEYFEESPKPKKSEVTEIASIYRNLSQNSRGSLYDIVLQTQNLALDTSVDGEVDDLLLFPLQVLTKLYENFSPENVEMAVALSVRQTSIDLGIVDALLICMNHFAHNDCSDQPMKHILKQRF